MTDSDKRTRLSDLQNIGPRGLECRHCGCKHFYVLYTRPLSAAESCVAVNAAIAGSGSRPTKYQHRHHVRKRFSRFVTVFPDQGLDSNTWGSR